MSERHWRDWPPLFSHVLSSAALLAAKEPFNVGFVDIRADDPMPIHWHDAFEIGYVLDGEGLFVIEDVEFPFGPGQVHVINNTQRHMAYADEHARFFNVHFHPDILSDYSFPALAEAAYRPFGVSQHAFAPLLPAQDPHTQEIVRLLRALAEEHRTAGPHWPVAAKGLILQMIALLLRHFVTVDAPDPAAVRRRAAAMRLMPALHLIEQNLADPPDRATLARAVALSPSRFNAVFHNAMGVSPVIYRNRRRIAEAQRLLTHSDAPIATIAEQCGFTTVQQFNRVFRQSVGCPPGVYRDRARGRSRTCTAPTLCSDTS